MEIQRPKSKQPIPENAKRVFKGIILMCINGNKNCIMVVKQFLKIKRPDTVVILPILPDGKILLNEQEQPGKESFIGTAGGRIDEGEEVLKRQKRIVGRNRL